VHVLVPYATAAGWVVFAIELAAGLLLLLGWHTSLGAIIGTSQALVITLLVAPAPDAWRWGFALLVIVNVVPLAAPTNLRLSIDALTGRA